MTKLEFLKELESLLPDIPSEEREEALRYYNGYFEDAGEDQEEEIIKEIGSPSKVAAIIKADLNSNAADRESRGYFTEKGYQDTTYTEEKYELVGTGKAESTGNDGNTNTGNNSTVGDNASNNNTGNNNYNNYRANNTNNNANNNANNNVNNNASASNSDGKYGYNSNNNQGSKGPNYSRYTNGTQNANANYQQRKSNSNTALYVIIGILTFPIWFPFLMSAIGIAIGVIAAILGIIFGFGVAGITMMGVGVALFFAGLIQISAPFIGVLLIGTGLLVLGLGMLFMIACIMLCKNVLPAFIKGIVHLCRLPFKNRSVMA